MPRYFAFLRGINVGGHRVKMGRLRELVEELGFEHVETFIASGNVIFSSASQDVHTMEERIARHLQEALGYAVPTLIRSQSELESIATFEPSGSTPAYQSVYVIFLPEAADVELRRSLDDLSTDDNGYFFAELDAWAKRPDRLLVQGPCEVSHPVSEGVVSDEGCPADELGFPQPRKRMLWTVSCSD